MSGRRKLESVELEDTRGGERRTVETPAVFSMIGALPNTAWLPREIKRDTKGFILTGAAVAQSPEWQNMSRLPEPLETSRPGVFAAGDVRSGSVKRCAAAVGEGGTAIENVHRSLAALVKFSTIWGGAPADSKKYLAGGQHAHRRSYEIDPERVPIVRVKC
jgi:thioredoxin reductase (NADPH)